MKELKKKFVKPALIKFEKPLDEVTLCHNHGSGGGDWHPRPKPPCRWRVKR